MKKGYKIIGEGLVRTAREDEVPDLVVDEKVELLTSDFMRFPCGCILKKNKVKNDWNIFAYCKEHYPIKI